MKTRAMFIILASCAAIIVAGDSEKHALDLSKAPDGDPPAEVFAVDGIIKVKSLEGRKVLEIDGSKPEVDAGAVIGNSTNGAASIEARVFATKAGRSCPRFGIGIHGQTGCRLMIVPAKKELQLIKNDAVLKAVPFDWHSGTWVRLKLSAIRGTGEKWIVIAKAWAADAAEPADAQITHEDSTLRPHGQCSIWGTPYAGTPIDFADIGFAVEN